MKQLTSNLDFWGFTTSLLCAIHCALLPVLLSFGLLGSSFAWITHPLFELTIALFTIYFVYQSLLKGFVAGHVHKSSYYLAITGLILILIHHFLGKFATTTVVVGGSIIALSHFQNLFLHRKIAANSED